MEAATQIQTRWSPLGGGFIRDNLIVTLLDGSQWYREWTPTLAEGKRFTRAEAKEFAAKYAERGGGWSVPKVQDHVTRVDYTTSGPATYPELKDDTKPEWYVAGDEDPSAPSSVAFVYFYFGLVDWFDAYRSGLLRLVRLSPARQ